MKYLERRPQETAIIDQEKASIRDYLDFFDPRLRTVLSRHPDATALARAVAQDLMMHAGDPVKMFARLIAWDEVMEACEGD